MVTGSYITKAILVTISLIGLNFHRRDKDKVFAYSKCVKK